MLHSGLGDGASNGAQIKNGWSYRVSARSRNAVSTTEGGGGCGA